MRQVSRVALISSLGLLSLAAGCHRSGEHRGSRNAADPEHENNDDTLRGAKGETRSAARRIAAARCDREVRCNNVGADQKFASNDACEDQIRTEWANDLNVYECPNGVVEKDLEECLGAIRDEECNSPFDTLSRVAECTASQICAD